MWSIARRLKQPRTRWSLWKRSLLLFVSLCLLIQAVSVHSLWRESQFRKQLKSKGNFALGTSPLPVTLDAQLRRWIGPEKTDLFAPIVELYLSDPTATDLNYVAKLTNLKALEIKGGPPDATSLKRVGTLRQLATLCLCDMELDRRSLSGLANCPKLCRIKLMGKMTPEVLEPLKNCESLRELYLEGDNRFEINRESHFTREHLAVIARIPHLKHLMIQAGDIGDSELRGLGYARELESLTVHSLRLQTDAINVLGRLPRLQQLVLEPTYDFDPCEPRPLKGFLSLKAFSITNSRITSSFIASLAKLPKLEALSFNECRVNENVAELGELPKLKFLDLSAADVQSSPYRKIGHLNASEFCEVFVDEQIYPSPNPEVSPTVRREVYFNQPEWPEICPNGFLCFFF